MPRPNKYLSEIIEYGGEFMARGAVIADMQRSATPQPLIDRWLQGQEHASCRDVTFKKAPAAAPKPPKT